MLRTMLLMIGLLLCAAGGTGAEEIELNVIRAGGNLYFVEAEDLYIQTEYCFEIEDRAAVVLSLDEQGDTLVFSANNSRCDIKQIYARTTLAAGSYLPTLSREDDNWYVLTDQDAALKTEGCLSLVENAAAQLVMAADGRGTLTLPAVDEVCRVEGVYAKTEVTIEHK